MPATTAVAAKTVIVADDTAFVRERFRTALESAGHRAAILSDATSLLARLRADAAQIDLVIVDLRLPALHGTALVRAIRAVNGFHAPIVVFSGTIANAEEVRELSLLGVAGYINEYSTVQHIVPALSPHLFPDLFNRRTSPRVVVGLSVSYRVANSIAVGVTLNVSRGGLAIRTTSPLERGSTVKLRFRLPGAGRDTEAEATVAWSDKRLGMGLQFTRLDADAQAAIDDFVRARFFSNRKA